MKNTPIIPFGWWPRNWGLKGKSRDRAMAEYLYTGETLDTRLAEIEAENEDDLKQRLLNIQLKYKHIDQYEYDTQLARLQKSDDDLTLELLRIDYEYNKISRNQYEKQKADFLHEPWVCMPDVKWDPNDPAKSYFELDYNEYFVDFLRSNNYEGATPEEIVERWLNDVCRSVAMNMGEQDPAFVAETKAATKRKTSRSKRPIKTEYT
jgi:hypothetical protein